MLISGSVRKTAKKKKNEHQEAPLVTKAVLANERTSCLPVSRYLSEEDVLDTGNPFVQLLSGVVWLIRNGSIYINESQAAECDETQETGQDTEAPRAFFLSCFDLFTLCVQGGTHAMVCGGGSRDSSFSPFCHVRPEN